MWDNIYINIRDLPVEKIVGCCTTDFNDELQSPKVSFLEICIVLLNILLHTVWLVN